MPLEIRHTQRAHRDLLEIWHYIDQNDTSATDRLLRRIAAKVIQASEIPLMGRLRPEFGADLRSLVVGRYVVFYTLEPSTLRVVRVLHSTRDIAAVAFDPD